MVCLELFAIGCERAASEGDGAVGGAPRIAALSPAVAITLRDMGYEPWVVGRHGWDLALSPSVPVCGDQMGFDYEALVSARPTHVLVQWGARELPERLVRLGEQRGWLVHDVPLLGLGDVEAFAAWAGESLGPAPEIGLSAAEVSGGLRPARVDGAAGLRVLLVVPGEPAAALGPGSAHFELAARVGLGSALGPDAGPYVRLMAEDVLAMAPDGIVVFAPRGRDAAAGAPVDFARATAALGRMGALPIAAVESGRLAVVDDPGALTPSTALVGVAAVLRAVAEAWVGPADGPDGPLGASGPQLEGPAGASSPG